LSCDYAGRILAIDLHEHGEARAAFNQSRDMSALRAGNQVTFPVAGNRTVFDFRWTFTDRDRVDDLTSCLTRGTGVLCTPHNTPRAKMADQFPLQDAPGLDEQTAVNRFVGHLHVPIVCKVHLEPTRNLLG
jgi:hypothetical protein